MHVSCPVYISGKEIPIEINADEGIQYKKVNFINSPLLIYPFDSGQKRILNKKADPVEPAFKIL